MGPWTLLNEHTVIKRCCLQKGIPGRPETLGFRQREQDRGMAKHTAQENKLPMSKDAPRELAPGRSCVMSQGL